jgi:hypothetical protein
MTSMPPSARYPDETPYDHGGGEIFWKGSSYAHAAYLVDMRLKHPILYFLWYRWWVMWLLHEDELRSLTEHMQYIHQKKYNPTWVYFSGEHPVLFLFYLLFHFTFQTMVKFFSTPRKIVNRLHSSFWFTR